jgi:hypothetical protein
MSNITTMEITKEQQKRANIIARRNGHNKATKIVFGDSDKIVSTIAFGYRKKTTGEYVSNSYRKNFGWKNTYYQRVECVVMLKSE